MIPPREGYLISFQGKTVKGSLNRRATPGGELAPRLRGSRKRHRHTGPTPSPLAGDATGQKLDCAEITLCSPDKVIASRHRPLAS